MSRRCQISKLQAQNGHRVSHSNNKSKHLFDVNLQTKRFFVAEENRYIKLRISTRMIRTIDKLGLKPTLTKYGLTLKDVSA